LIGLESESGYSDVSRGFWPFGISSGVIDRLQADVIGERHATQEYVTVSAPEEAGQIVSGIYPDRWMGRSATVVLKNPQKPARLAATFFIPPAARARHVALLLEGREVAAATYPSAGTYTLQSAPVQAASGVATVEINVDRTFSALPDRRELGMVLAGVGFVP